MNEQPTTQDSSEAPKQKGSETIIGVLIIIIIILIVGGFYIFKKGNLKIQTPVSTTEKTVQPEATAPEVTGSTENQVTQPSQTEASASQNPVDFDYELKQLDTQVGSVSATDFNDSEMTDTKAGL